MGLFDFFPYTSGHTLNLDWIIKQVNGSSSALAAHVDNKNNPHEVTAEQVSAAPRTYVDKTGSVNSYEEFLAVIENQFLAMPDNSQYNMFYNLTASTGTIPAGSWFINIKREWENFGVVELINETYNLRITKFNNWLPPEWVVAPMLQGVEFRTVERWNGLPVYTKLLNCGQWSVNGLVDTGVNIGGKVIRYSGTIDNIPLPSMDANIESTWTAWVQFGTSGNNYVVNMRKGSSWAGGQTYVQMWYTKG